MPGSTSKLILVAFLRRSGGHTVIDSIGRSHEGATFLNNFAVKAYKKDTTYFYQNGEACLSTPEAERDRNKDTLIGCTEDRHIDEITHLIPEMCSSYDTLQRVVVLRNFFSVAASRDAAKKANKTPINFELLPRIQQVWVDQAKAFLAGNQDVVLYDRFVADPTYGDELTARYGFEFRRVEKQSTFFAHGHKTGTKDHLSRWREAPEVPDLHPEIPSLNSAIFEQWIQ
jgi:hypothetical protein